MKNIEKYKPVSEAPPATNLIPLVPPGMENKREMPQPDGTIVANYTNLDGTPFLSITRNPEDKGQNPRVYIQPDTPLEVAFVIRGKAEAINVFGSEKGVPSKTVEIEGEVDKLNSFGDAYVHVKKANHVSAYGSHVEVEEKIQTAVAQEEGVIHGKSEITKSSYDGGGYVYADKGVIFPKGE